MLATLTTLLLSQTALAVPSQFTHQGRLLDADGMALEDEVTITFRLTVAETGGDVLWEEPLTVSLNNGFYSAILGADEDDNPLDTEVLSQAPVWLELQLDGEPAMFPRSPVHSVPYAAMATVAETLVGGPVDAETVAVGGMAVINEAGEWVGPESPVNWSDIEGIPEDFADGVDDDTDTDTDSLAALAMSCVDGDIPVWDAVVEAWACDYDQDTLAGIGCLVGQLIHWSGDSMGWVCADDVDTFLTEEDVDSMVADNGYAMASEVFSSSFEDLVDVPDGLDDGDDDTQLSEADVDGMVSDNGYAMATDVFSSSFGDLTDVPDGLDDGDDDTQLSEADVDGMVSDNGYAMATDVFSSSFGDLADVPDGLDDGDDDTQLSETDVELFITNAPINLSEASTIGDRQPALLTADDGLTVEGPLESTLGGVKFPDGTVQTTASVVPETSSTLMYTRCAWTGANAYTIGSCTPPTCPVDGTDLGIIGNVKTGTATWATSETNSSYSEASGYSERACLITGFRHTLYSRCAWTGAHAYTIGSCTPQVCPDEWTDLGITGNVKSGTAGGQTSESNASYGEASGYSERVCVY